MIGYFYSTLILITIGVLFMLIGIYAGAEADNAGGCILCVLLGCITFASATTTLKKGVYAAIDEKLNNSEVVITFPTEPEKDTIYLKSTIRYEDINNR